MKKLKNGKAAEMDDIREKDDKMWRLHGDGLDLVDV